MSRVMLELLQQAVASPLEEALTPLLAVWQQVRDPGLAEVIEGVSAQVSRARIARYPPVSRAQPAWLRLARTAGSADLGVLLTDLLTGRERWFAQERIEALERFPPDPRIARALVDVLLGRLPSMDGSGWTKLYTLLVKHADPRTLAWLSRITRTTELARALGELERLFSGVLPVELPAEAWAILAPLRRSMPLSGKDTRTEEDFLRAIAADPGDDAPRLVYADWLQEKGDPRGDFIALQHRRHAAGTLPEGDGRREAELLERYAFDWLGPVLHRLLQPRWRKCRFARGFLTVAHVFANQVTLDAAAGHIGWSTVEELRLEESVWERLECERFFDGRAFAALRFVCVPRPAVLVEVAASPLGARLQRLRARAALLDQLGGVLAEILALRSPPTIELTLGAHGRLGTLAATCGPDGGRTELTLDVAGSYLLAPEVLPQALAQLDPSAIKRFRVVEQRTEWWGPAYKATIDALPEALRRFPGVALQRVRLDP